MTPYSFDLRQRVVTAYQSGAYTIAELTELFDVGRSFIKKMLRLHRQGESLEPRHGGGASPALNQEQLEMLRAAVQTRPDATLGELKSFLRAEYKVTVSQATVCRYLQALDLPRKKRASRPVSATSGSAARSAAKRPDRR